MSLKIDDIKNQFIGVNCYTAIELKTITNLFGYQDRNWHTLIAYENESTYPIIVSSRKSAVINKSEPGYTFVNAQDVIKENPIPIFKTEDGFDIFYPDKTYMVSDSTSIDNLHQYYGCWNGNLLEARYFMKCENAIGYIEERDRQIPKKQLTAKELQQIKLETEIQIEKILSDFNQLCAENDFQVSGINYQQRKTDHNREFEIDIQIE